MQDSAEKKVFIALPTYNEAPNVSALIQAINKTASTLRGWKLDILVIDDNSPDGTADIVRGLQSTCDNLHLIVGDKKGLGAAYTRGMLWIIKHYDPDFIMEMDADFQHNPADIPRFLEKAENGAQFIIGSRYIAGGDYPDWTFKRKVYSWGANFIARYIAGIYKVEDCTSGYRCISTDFLKSFDLTALKSNGYSFQMALLHAAKTKKLHIAEIPIHFPDRKHGISKLGADDIKEFFINALKLRFRRYDFTC